MRFAVALCTASLAVVACKKTSDENPAQGGLDQMRAAKAMEAKTKLGELGRAARVYAMEERVARGGAVAPPGFPVGDTGFQPAPGTCCQQGGTCNVQGGEWNADPFPSLEFGIAEPFSYSYRYASDGRTFTATAVGDLDCDGTYSTFMMTGEMTGEGPTVGAVAVEQELE